MGRTSIPCLDETRDLLAANKPQNTTWDEYLQTLAGESDALHVNSNELTYDDAREACKAALRQELPDHIFR